jgi:hypothetical protein
MLFGTVAMPRSPDRPEADRAYQADKGAVVDTDDKQLTTPVK